MTKRTGAGTSDSGVAGDGATMSSQDWVARVIAALEDLVELIRDKSVRPVLFGVRIAIMSLIAMVLVAVVLVTLVIGLSRLFDDLVFSGHVWATDLAVGGIFAVAGVFLLTRSNKRQESKDASS